MVDRGSFGGALRGPFFAFDAGVRVTRKRLPGGEVEGCLAGSEAGAHFCHMLLGSARKGRGLSNDGPSKRREGLDSGAGIQGRGALGDPGCQDGVLIMFRMGWVHSPGPRGLPTAW